MPREVREELGRVEAHFAESAALLLLLPPPLLGHTSNHAGEGDGA